ncbi:Pentatricopeptide repeat-containing protein [Thalictrum thalictroides]|uniref:Pentatricopeptide repeat-containing protein n=1 Tax=Thalictrum thalictroides TaxID=46969 RepID=A0A7J6VRK8_THATH|nr:Pentatricopeptide repeat-containing protein [Thalictrum thalictroides]
MAIRSLSTNLRRSIIQRNCRVILSNQFSSSIPLTTDDDLEEIPKKDDDLKSRIFRLRFPKRSATNILEKWVAEGNKITISELRNIAKDLRKSQRYKHALEISEWMVRHQEYEVLDSDYGVRIDLMTKVFGIDAAERYFEGLPLTAKTGETYTALLHSYAGAKLTEKAERLFDRLKEADVILNAMIYNEMMTLYMSVGQLEKVSSVIEELKRRKVSPDLFTYNLWISSCAANLDIDSVKQILDEMSCDSNANDGWIIYRQLTNIYVTAGNLVNSECNSLIETEKKITQRECITYDFLILLYTGLKNKEMIDQIWKSLRMAPMKMTSRNYVCIISCYLMLNHSREAGEVFEQWKQSTTTDFDSHACTRLLNAFEGARLVEKADMLRAIMKEKSCESADESQEI